MEQQEPDKAIMINRRLKQWARKLKREIIVLYFVLKHPLVPLYIKISAAFIVGYALSPIDLIPDFIPVLGYLDDVIFLPLGIMLVIRLIPNAILQACREEAENNPPAIKPKIWIAAYIIIILWIIFFIAIYRWVRKTYLVSIQ
jgi:Uncharacterized conserved protein